MRKKRHRLIDSMHIQKDQRFIALQKRVRQHYLPMSLTVNFNEEVEFVIYNGGDL